MKVMQEKKESKQILICVNPLYLNKISNKMKNRIIFKSHINSGLGVRRRRKRKKSDFFYKKGLTL